MLEGLQIPRESYEYTTEQRRGVLTNSEILDVTEYEPVSDKKEIYKLDVPYTTIEHFSMIAGSVESYKNFFDALEKGYFVPLREGDSLLLDAVPIPREKISDTLVHVVSYEKYKQIQDSDFIGDPNSEGFVYLQSPETIVLPNDNLYEKGKIVARMFIDTDTLFRLQRKIYLDEESICETPEEYEHSFAMFGGIPKSAVKKVEVMKIGKLDYTPFFEDIGLLGNEGRIKQADKEYNRRLQSLRDRVKAV